MQVKIRKIGNSLGIIIPEKVLHQMNVDEGDVVNIIDSDKGVLLTPFDQDFVDVQKYYKLFSKKYRNALNALAK